MSEEERRLLRISKVMYNLLKDEELLREKQSEVYKAESDLEDAYVEEESTEELIREEENRGQARRKDVFDQLSERLVNARHGIEQARQQRTVSLQELEDIRNSVHQHNMLLEDLYNRESQ